MPRCHPQTLNFNGAKLLNTEWLAGFEPFALLALVLPVYLSSFCIQDLLFPRIVVWRKGGAQNKREHFLFLGPLVDEKKPSVVKFVINKSFFAHFTPTHPRRRHQIRAPQAHVPQIPRVYTYFACELVLSAQELYAIVKMAAAGPAAVDDEAVVVPLRNPNTFSARI